LLLQKLEGMFAFAIWGRKGTDPLRGALDRLGEKPFYYFENSKEFVFARVK
jgi:asparagine synthase (glutamine-hydrolysing)